LACVKRRAQSGSSGIFAALGSVEESIADASARVDLYTMYLPRLGRWEAELAAGDLTQVIDTGALFADLDRLTSAVDRVVGVAETAPALLERERRATVAAVQAEREAMIDALRQERVATLEQVEAMAVRLTDRTSPIVMAAVREQHDAFVASLEAARSRTVLDASVELREIVDHAALRAAQLLLGVGILALIGVALHAWLAQGKA
jgi:hypothetical protein